jgi:hypothetical protein
MSASIKLLVFYNYGQPETEDIVYAVSVSETSCKFKGRNPFKNVSAAYILLEGPLFPQISMSHGRTVSPGWIPTCVAMI